MAEVTSGDVTVIVLSQDETEALSSVLTDWYNIMRDAVAEGEDPHGFTQQTGALLSSVADALGVYPGMETE